MCIAGVIANLGKAIGGQVSNFDPRSLTDALWGFAKMGGKLDGGTISKLAQRVKELASKFKPQEAANALWALVKLDQQNGGNAMKVLPGFDRQSVATNVSCGKNKKLVLTGSFRFLAHAVTCRLHLGIVPMVQPNIQHATDCG